jgi:serine/threonine protein kinase/tetratricopeptide (TPR) repeat protein
MIGQTIAHYQIQELLAEGAMGVVYKARDLNLERFVAIKFLKPQRSSDEAAMARFIHEAKAASSLDHPNVCTIYEIEKDAEGRFFIVMAYYEGETLRRKLGHGPLLIEDALRHTVDIAQGLAKAHRHGLIHRDIKPENVIVTTEGVVKILDFGLVKLSRDPAQNKRETVVGTVGYMSPEQIDGRADHRSDLWSLGVVFYEMVTGRRPFVGTPSQVIEAIAHGEIPRASELRHGITDEVEQVLTRCLARNPAERYQRAEELLAHLHALRHGVGSSTSIQVPGASPTPMAIAVLPFTNVGGGEEAEYFSDGLTDELIHLLSQLKGLRVVSHTSAFEFKGKSQDVRTIADRLNVNTVLEGSVRQSGIKLRVMVQLTDAVHGYHLWSQKYDHEMKDVFAIQEDIAVSVAGMFEKKLKAEVAPLRPRYTGNVDAHGLYLKGRYYWGLRIPEASRKGMQCFEQAIAVDPMCAPAYAGLADCFVSLGFWGVMPPSEAWARGRELALKAREIDPYLAEAEIVLAKCFLFNNSDWRQAEELVLHAIELDPVFSGSHFFYSILLLQSGRHESALLELRTARQLDPLSSSICAGIAWAHYYAGNYELAIEQCGKVFDLSPDYVEGLACMGLVAIRKGEYEAALSWLERGVASSGNSPLGMGFLGYAYALAGRPADARAILMQFKDVAKQRYVSTIAPALIHIGLGEEQEALEWLDKAYQGRDAFLAYAKIFPPFDPLRETTKFQELLGKLALASSEEQLTSEVLAL